MYPPDFVCRVKNAFPDFAYLHGMLDSGDFRVGGVLKTYCPVGLTSMILIYEIANQHDHELVLVAERLLEIQGLYDEWCFVSATAEGNYESA